MPISKTELKILLDYLNDTLFEVREKGNIWCSCDHTKNRSRAFLVSRGLPTEPILRWFEEYGGFCDCEICANVGDRWELYLSD